MATSTGGPSHRVAAKAGVQRQASGRATGRAVVAASQPAAARPTLREEQRQLTRSRIAEAALATFCEKGYIATTVEDVVARAGTSRATFYQHFENKHAALELATGGVETWSFATYDLLREGELTRARVTAMVTEVFRHWADNTALLRVLLEAEAVEPGRRARNMQKTEQAVDRIFGPHLQRLTGRRREVARVELFMAGMVTSRYMAYEFGTDRRRADLRVPIEAMTNVVWNILAPHVQR